jgi:hypothetical protein
MIHDDGVGEGKELPSLLVDFLSSSGRLLLMAFQSFRTAGIYPCRPSAFSHRRAYTSSLPRNRLRKQRRLDGFRGKWPFRRKLRNRNAVNRQKPPQASILLAETNIFLLRRFEWKRV